MQKVLKYTIDTSPKKLDVPFGGRIIHVEMQFGSPRIWVLVNEAEPLVIRHFERTLTGHEVPDDRVYLGTAISDEGDYVVHLFEFAGPAETPLAAQGHYWEHPVIPQKVAPDADVNLLAHLFWKHLPAWQRLNSLIYAGILEDSKSAGNAAHLPQTMEATLIRSASRESLAKLWDQVVEVISTTDPTHHATSRPNPYR